MNKIGINFFENLEIRLKLNLACFNDDLNTSLTIRENKAPFLELDSLSSPGFIDITLAEQERQSIKCSTVHGEYMLVDCTPKGDRIYPRYVVQGSEAEQFKGVEVSLTGFSSWFDPNPHFAMTDGEIKQTIPTQKIDETVVINGERYQVSSQFCSNISNIAKRDFLLLEYTTLKVVKIDGTITVAEAERLLQDIRRLFSLLLGQPLAIDYAWLISQQNGARRAFYFSASGSRAEPFEEPHECLIHGASIFKNQLWANIFNHYYSLPTASHFEDIWSRLPMLFNFSGIWEYEILGYVSILDAWCIQTIHNKNSAKSGGEGHNKDRDYIEAKLVTQVQEELLLVVDKHQKQLGPQYHDAMNRFRSRIKKRVNTGLNRNSSFKLKFDYLMSKVAQGVKDMIDFSTDEFAAIKKIRDFAAHAQSIDNKDKRDISFEYGLKCKLQVLLYYFVYRDLGFSAKDYAICLQSSSNEFVRHANINHACRDKLTGLVPFYPVDKGCFAKAAQGNRFNVAVEHSSANSGYRWGKQLTEQIQLRWMSAANKEHRTLLDYVKTLLVDNPEVEVSYIHRAWLSCGEESLLLNGVCLVTYRE
ncbi:MAG: hypothetical protein ACI8WB_006008 [Phenylobacterium sp.]|jgi:hypothetical protein